MLKLPSINLKRMRTLAVTMLFIALQFPVFAFVPQKVSAAANNGTLKVHEFGTASGTESNDPKVCQFNFEGFNFDANDSGYIVIDGQGQTSGSHGPFNFGPTDLDGYYATPYYNSDGGTTIPDGHFKATLYGKDTGGNVNLEDEKAKSKVFKVECADPDVCPLVPGTQTSQAECDVCPNVEGTQSTLAECDVCPNVEGTQSTLAECDVCPNDTGTQTSVDDCEEPGPAAPTATATIVPCTENSGDTDKVSVSVTNTDDETNDSVTYTVSLGGQNKEITLADGASGNVEFDGLAEGSYSATINGDDNTQATTNSVVVEKCEVREIKGSITIIKDAEPDTDDEFDFTATNGDDVEDFTLGDEDSKTFDDLSEGEYSFTEKEHENWELKKIQCYYTPVFLFQSIHNDIVLGPDVDIDGNTVTVDLGEGENVTCKFVNEPGKVSLCHATGSEGNPFVKITISAAGAFNGHLDDGSGGTHGDHQNGEDIIPPFDYKGTTYSQNWDAEGQALYRNDCVVPEEEPEPALPVIVVTLEPCTEDSGNNDNVIVSVTNTDDETDETVTYTINLGGQTKEMTLEDGETDVVTFTGLAVGSYTATVTGDDETEATSNSVAVKNCPEEGDILGETLTPGGPATVLADTGSDILATIFAALALIGLTCSLAVPTMRAQYE